MSLQTLSQFQNLLRKKIVSDDFPEVTKEGLRDFLDKFAREIDYYVRRIGFYSPSEIDSHIGDDTIHFTEGLIDHDNLLNFTPTEHFTEGSINHGNIQNIGTNSHTAIDSHIGDGTIHFTEGSIDHAAISNIGSNSHAAIDSHIALTNPHIDWTTDQGVTNINPGNYIDTDTTYINSDWDHDQLTNFTVNEHFTEGSIDHANIQNTGTNTHASIDSHIANGAIHFTQSSISITESQISDLGTYILASEKGSASGVATLDGSSKIPTNQLPALSLTDTNVVANESAQLALTAQEGDLAIRTDENKTYAHNGGTAGTMADWSELLTPTSAVTSVDGRTGAVTLDDLYATSAQGSTADSALQDLTGSSIKTLSDVYSSMTPTDGQHLVFDTTNGWQAETVSDNDTTDHTAFSNIGTNTHAVIDTHLANGTIHFIEGDIDHRSIKNVGTNSHAVIDTHIGNGTIHFTEASIDHAAIQNIGTNSHAVIDTHLGLANEHIDWTQISIGNIHSGNYTDTTDHTALSNIGTNSHATLDTFKTTTEAVHNSRARATTNDGQSIPHATFTIVSFEDEVYDGLGEYDSTSNIGRFTAANAGYYQVNCFILFASAVWTINNVLTMSIYKNGSLISYLNRRTIVVSGSRYYDLRGSDTIYLTAGQYIDIRIFQNTGSAKSLYTPVGFNHFSIHRLS